LGTCAQTRLADAARWQRSGNRLGLELTGLYSVVVCGLRGTAVDKRTSEQASEQQLVICLEQDNAPRQRSSNAKGIRKRNDTNLGRLAQLLPNHFPLVAFVVLDGLHQSGALLVCQQSFLSRSRVCEADEIADLVFRELGVVHILLSGEQNL
jgi:hypothetical protein